MQASSKLSTWTFAFELSFLPAVNERSDKTVNNVQALSTISEGPGPRDWY